MTKRERVRNALAHRPVDYDTAEEFDVGTLPG